MNRKSADRLNDEKKNHSGFYSSAGLDTLPAPPSGYSSNKPLLDQIFPLHVLEDGKKIIIRAFLNGFTREQIEVRLDPREIRILVSLPAKHPENGQDHVGGLTKLHRNYRFSMTVNPRLCAATFMDGVLQVEISKKPGDSAWSENEVVITEEKTHHAQV